MSEEKEVAEIEQPEINDQIEDTEAPPARTVPLEALEAERRKRQDLEAQNRALQDLMTKSNAPKQEEPDEDPEEFITKAELVKRIEKATFSNKREVLEEAYCSAKPEAIELINTHLENIIKKKPWLAQTIESAPNRYARAYEIVQDYMPRQQEVAPEQKYRSPQAEAKRVVENSQKPGNPSTIAKPASMSNQDYLKSIAGKPEFRDYRKKVMSGG